MIKITKGALFLAVAVLLLSAPRAAGQSFCGSCDPYGSCDVSCWYCTELVDPQYGSCPEYAYVVTTCGDFLGACTPSNCTPNWVTSDRTNVGTYGETTYGFQCNPWPYCYPTFGCEHHKVDRVTETDLNECNTSEYYWERTYCDDYVDFTLPHRPSNPPDCCAYPFYCNDWHSCY